MIEVQHDKICISGNQLIKHDAYNYTGIPFLINSLFRLHQIDKSKKIFINFNDGEPIKFGGFDHIVNLIATELNLLSDQLIISTVDKSYTNPNATTIYVPNNFFRFVNHAISNSTNWQLQFDSKLFGAVFGRFSLERFLLASFLDTQVNDNFTIFQPRQSWLETQFADTFAEMYKEELHWYTNRTKDTHTLDSGVEGCVHWKQSCDDYVNIWPKYKIEIVSETDVHTKYWITEKTVRCLLTKKPFILMGGCGSLQYLRDLGFQTFSPWFNESYDQEPILNYRLQMIQQEILRISQLSEFDKLQIFAGVQSALNYNQLNYNKIINDYYKNFKNDISN